MSRAEKKLRELKAKEEIARLKAEKRERQKQEWQAQPEWAKRTAIILGALIILVVLIAATNPPKSDVQSQGNQISDSAQEPAQEAEKVKKSPQEKMFDSLSVLIASGQAFDTGSYVKGDIPKGEYAFVTFDGGGQYYSEEDSAGNIIDNENFDSFGYVYVHGVGNVETQGVLIKVGALKKLGAKNAKKVYETLNNTEDYHGAAWYKVGADLKPGQYTIKSYGEAYVAVMSGPVGDSEIVDNNNFKGKYSVSVQSGQYLQVSRGEILR